MTINFSPSDIAKVSINDLNFYYDTFHALKSISMQIRKNKITAFIGPSGCGKSTLLRTMNRMYQLYPSQIAKGEILMDGFNILDKAQDLNCLRAKMGMVFQHFLQQHLIRSLHSGLRFGVE